MGSPSSLHQSQYHLIEIPFQPILSPKLLTSLQCADTQSQATIDGQYLDELWGSSKLGLLLVKDQGYLMAMAMA